MGLLVSGAWSFYNFYCQVRQILLYFFTAAVLSACINRKSPISGQERFGNMTRVYYKEAVGAFIVFDVTRAATFEAVVKWKLDLDTKVQLPDGSPIPCVLLANKCDQPKEGLVNSAARMDEYCKERGFIAWFETSAKENINIEDAAKCLVTKILQNDKMIHNNESPKDLERFTLDGRNLGQQKGKTCAC